MSFFEVLSAWFNMLWSFISGISFFGSGFTFGHFFIALFGFFMAVALLVNIFGGRNSNGK